MEIARAWIWSAQRTSGNGFNGVTRFDSDDDGADEIFMATINAGVFSPGAVEGLRGDGSDLRGFPHAPTKMATAVASLTDQPTVILS